MTFPDLCQRRENIYLDVLIYKEKLFVDLIDGNSFNGIYWLILRKFHLQFAGRMNFELF